MIVENTQQEKYIRLHTEDRLGTSNTPYIKVDDLELIFCSNYIELHWTWLKIRYKMSTMEMEWTVNLRVPSYRVELVVVVGGSTRAL